jgi:hypothetical protein
MIDMRGPETAQFGMTLSLLSRYFKYSGDSDLLLKHRAKIEATAKLLTDMHDESLKISAEEPGFGLIRGWSESDSCLMENPAVYWQPYYANTAFAARGLKDIATTWESWITFIQEEGSWLLRQVGRVEAKCFGDELLRALRKTSKQKSHHLTLGCSRVPR